MDAVAAWQLVTVGLAVGTCVGLTGMGGGALMTPILILIGIPPTSAVGSDLTASVVMKPFSAFVHGRGRTVEWRLVRWLVPAGVPAAFLGPFLLRFLGDEDALETRVKFAIGCALLLGVVAMLVRFLLLMRQNSFGESVDHPQIRPFATLLVAAVGGLVVGMTSVGSGSLIITMLMMIYPHFPARRLVGTDLAQAIPLVAAAALGQFLVGNVDFGLTGWLLVGSIPGSILGATLAVKGVPSALLRWILAIVILASGLNMLELPTGVAVGIPLAVAAIGAIYTVLRRRTPTAAEPHAQHTPDRTT
jgi:uncharacterized protein